jgi:hypothetical protein
VSVVRAAQRESRKISLTVGKGGAQDAREDGWGEAVSDVRGDEQQGVGGVLVLWGEVSGD